MGAVTQPIAVLESLQTGRQRRPGRSRASMRGNDLGINAQAKAINFPNLQTLERELT